tara:strand:+ start:1284 stop:1514 length:231 start_codon:yes stop_codon:yes gene_type:complete
MVTLGQISWSKGLKTEKKQDRKEYKLYPHSIKLNISRIYKHDPGIVEMKKDYISQQERGFQGKKNYFSESIPYLKS